MRLPHSSSPSIRRTLFLHGIKDSSQPCGREPNVGSAVLCFVPVATSLACGILVSVSGFWHSTTWAATVVPILRGRFERQNSSSFRLSDLFAS